MEADVTQTALVRRAGTSQAAVALASATVLESLDETLDILSQSGALAEIRESSEDIAAGRVVSIKEVRAEFGRPGE